MIATSQNIRGRFIANIVIIKGPSMDNIRVYLIKVVYLCRMYVIILK